MTVKAKKSTKKEILEQIQEVKYQAYADLEHVEWQLVNNCVFDNNGERVELTPSARIALLDQMRDFRGIIDQVDKIINLS